MASLPTDTNDGELLRLDTRPDFSFGQSSLSLVDLFSGCGGMTLGLAWAAHRRGLGVRVQLAVDIETTAIAVYQDNFPNAACVVADVATLFDGGLDEPATTASERMLRRRIGEQTDILVGGPPCQGHSDLNNRTRRHDDRNSLYARMARAARVLRPALVVIENVPAVLLDRDCVVDRTEQALRDSGYECASRVLDLARLGVPQTRERHLLLAAKNRALDPRLILAGLERGVATEPRDVAWAIADLVETEGIGELDRASRSSPECERRIAWLVENNAHELPDSLRPSCHRDKQHKYKSVYGRLRWDRPAQTITSGFGCMGQGRYVHPSRPRTLTPHEAARLQTFPDFFSFRAVRTRKALARLIGNAVPPLLMARVGELILDHWSTMPVPARRGSPGADLVLDDRAVS